MVITLTPATGSAVTLIDGPGREVDKTMGPLVGMSGSVGTPVQDRKPIRKAFAKPLQRGGSVGNLSFAGVRLCASQDAARTWLIGHLAAFPLSGTPTLTDTGLVTTMADAVIALVSYRWQGISVHLDYQVTHGEVSVAAAS